MLRQFQPGQPILHAYILAAADAAVREKESAALAAAMLCTASGARPCGQCRDCRKVFRGLHPDVICVDPASGSKRPVFKVDQIREISADAYIMPSEAQRKVYVLRQADTMNPAAQNALLKLLEEPPRSASFILAAERAESLLPTVRSRCARWICAGEERQRDPELQKLAESFLNLVARKDRAALLQWCFAREDLDGKRMRDFLDCAVDCVGDRAAGRAEAGGMSPAALLTLVRLLERCRGMLQVNTGVKHILGLLAVDAIAVERGV